MPGPDYISGDQLPPSEQRKALAQFVHRFTGEHRPDWANKPRRDGSAYPVQFADDSDWLANTRFAVTRGWRLDERVQRCDSSPTWPLNPELRKGAAT